MHHADLLEKHFRLTPQQKKSLAILKIRTLGDLLYYLPSRYGEETSLLPIAELTKDANVSIAGKITSIKTAKAYRKKIPLTEATVEDDTGTIRVVWFHQAYIAKTIPEGSLVRLTGKVTGGKRGNYLANPHVERISDLPLGADTSLWGEGAGDILPVYPETRALSSRWFLHHIRRAVAGGAVEMMEDPLPEEILTQYHLPKLKTALIWAHMPQKKGDAESARKRFAFEEIFFIQIARQKERRAYQAHGAFTIPKRKKDVETFLSRFPFAPTAAQMRAIETITSDFEKEKPMLRLLEGDVGSGKTLVAAATAYATVTTSPLKRSEDGTFGRSSLASDDLAKRQSFGNLQIAYMAPTEILAQQHFDSFISYFSHLPINIALITGSGCKKFPSKVSPDKATDISRAQFLKWVANGEIAIVIGTHALIQKTVKFKDLAYVIIDEQHRFGVMQRAKLVRRGDAEQTRNIAEAKIDPFIYKDLTYRIRNVLFNVKKELGGGHKEIIYQKAVAIELEKASLSYSREVQIPIMYQKKRVGTYTPDFVIDDKIIVELKALPFVGAQEKKQIWRYLRGSSYRLALLANFGPRELTIDRVVYDTARASASVPQSSASVPHLLSMTATPIPRTLALTIYGDLDLTLLDEMPPGRKIPKTEVVIPAERTRVYEEITHEIAHGRQAYVICPRIDEPDPNKIGALQVKSVKAEAKQLQEKIFPKYRVGILHGKMKPKEKDDVMGAFSHGDIDILVATSVVEVGVNVPNATIIIIEGAERFGLAQLHQLRGRVLRSTHQAYCYLFTDTESGTSQKRLKAMKESHSGFELAEQDLLIRGAGELSGAKQWGISDIGMEAIKNIKMVEAARTEAQKLLDTDPGLAHHPLITARLASKNIAVHFE